MRMTVGAGKALLNEKRMKFRRFTKPKFLRQVGRELLSKLFGRFSGELEAKDITLPSADLKDDDYFRELSALAMAPDRLPDNLIEALFAIEEMANEEGQERLEAAAAEAGLNLKFDEESSYGDIAVQVFLAKPELLAQKHNEQRLTRLSTFEYFGSKEPVDRSDSFAAPDQATMDRVAGDLDAWFKEHNRGEQTTQIEVYQMESEFWFLVRHGDTFARTPKVEKRKTEVLHFRPAKDDVVVYSPERDELRIHAGTKGEKELYRKTFGTHLMGDDEYFSEHKAYTLEPLRELGVDALDVSDIDGLDRIVLREYEIAFDTGHQEVLIRKADDIFAAAQDSPFERDPIPTSGRLVRAAFYFYFEGCSKPRTVQVRLSNHLKLGRHCDAVLVHRWLTARGFRVTVENDKPQKGAGNVEVLAGA
jgi:hypothetical protein